ncbi:hypothetical protein C464_11043 [Halorubrum coriense DSM 10284]|uniref:DUF7344 domain-containing protein n=1 Tax=Halorubrum coriense DSM 10284 TaxID=1227466 RepID=M0EEY0_9EURY|nr:hypothetical protein [Halorubrum coriense]ELZ46346.1 hypothetical protein C464_11043 [Halorubrum coriense DSM 10284]
MIAKPGAKAGDPESPGPEPAGSEVEPAEIERAQIGFDQLFEILKNKRRRRVLRYLLEGEEEVTLDELAEAIAARETGKDVKQITSQERKRVYVGLYQCHLPKMDDYGAVSYNKPRGRIATAEHTDLFERYLSADVEAEDSDWTRYHSMLSLAAAAVLVVPVVLGAIGSNVTLQVVTALLVGALVGVSAFRYFA